MVPKTIATVTVKELSGAIPRGFGPPGAVIQSRVSESESATGDNGK